VEVVECGESDWSDYLVVLETALLVRDFQVIVASIYFVILKGTFLLHIGVGFLHCAAGPQYPFDVAPPFVL